MFKCEIGYCMCVYVLCPDFLIEFSFSYLLVSMLGKLN